MLLAALDAAHNALAFVHVSTTPIDLLCGLIAAWQADLASLPIALQTYASADITSAQAYLTALTRKVAPQQKGATACPSPGLQAGDGWAAHCAADWTCQP